jgi:ribosomal protein S18 acetylase RimI-like enzyme
MPTRTGCGTSIGGRRTDEGQLAMTDSRRRGELPLIRPARPADAERIAVVLAEAYLSTPEGVWLIPDLGERRAVYGAYFPAVVQALLAGAGEGVAACLHVTDEVDAVAVWENYGTIEPAPTQLYDNIPRQTCGRHADRFRLLHTVLAFHQPRDPHHQLSWLAVHPDRQNVGLGSALLRHGLTGWDGRDERPGDASYLVTASPQAREFCAHRGYQLHRPAPILLPDTGPALWPMWRGPESGRRFADSRRIGDEQ